MSLAASSASCSDAAVWASSIGQPLAVPVLSNPFRMQDVEVRHAGVVDDGRGPRPRVGHVAVALPMQARSRVVVLDGPHIASVSGTVFGGVPWAIIFSRRARSGGRAPDSGGLSVEERLRGSRRL
jgi:hypothetical protein